MAPASASLPEQQPFTFTSPVSSETHEDALDFDYGSWIEQSKTANHHSNNLWPHDAEAQAISRHHREMMLRAADSLPEEAYELSLRDLSELSLSSRATATDEPASSGSLRLSTARKCPSNTKPWRKKTPSTEGASFIIKLFMPSPSRAAGGGGGRRRKSFSSSTVPALRENNASVDSTMENAASGRRIDLSSTRSHSMPRKNHQDTNNRKPMGCYPLFNSSKYRVKREAGAGSKKREAGGRLCI